MNLLEQFAQHLRENGRSDVTIKNYLSDAKRFIAWLATADTEINDISDVTSEHIKQYRETLKDSLDPSSLKRHHSSLNQLFFFLSKQGLTQSKTYTPTQLAHPQVNTDDGLRLMNFVSYLRENQASSLTVKNYLSDVKQFIDWFHTVHLQSKGADGSSLLFTHLNASILQTYKDRLLSEKELSPVSINRKLSSIRAYLKFASKYGLIDHTRVSTTNVLPTIEDNGVSSVDYSALSKSPLTTTTFAESRLGPMRMLQRAQRLGYFLIDSSLISPLAEGFLICQKLGWRLSGGRLFYKAATKPLKRTQLDSLVVDNIEKAFYAPLSLSFKSLPLYKRVLLLLRYHRPFWYKKYHTYAFAHYLHFGILGIAVIVMGLLLYHRIAPSFEPQILGTKIIANGRKLQFRGQILDSNNAPLSGTHPLRFSLYDDTIASGSSLLWQDIQNVTADQQGNFFVTLGDHDTLPQDLFASGQSLYLGIAVDGGQELKPRQPIPNTHLAQDTTRLAGMLPTTDPDAGAANAILALDSAGNLTIGHNASPVFQATDGSLTLRAQELILETLPKSSGNITLSPDGNGIIDITKPIQNTSQYGSLPDTIGAVEIADSLAILATESGRSAFTINQNGNGPLISASSSGFAKFSLDNTGSGYFAGNVTLDGTDLSTNRFAINLFNRNAQIINLGGQAVAVTIGSQSGTTTIRTASTNVEGNLTIGGKTGLIFTGENTGISFSGSGSHLLKAQSGTLTIGSQLEIGKDLAILPATADGINNLGSAERPFDTIYVNNIVSSGVNGQPIYWTAHDGINQPLNISNDVIIGGNATSSAAWQVFGSGPDKGTASSSGNLSFSGSTTKISQLNGGSLQFLTSPGGTAGLTQKMTITNQGIGIGTSLPSFSLDVLDQRSATATAMITNLDTGAQSSALALKLGSTSPLQTNSFLTFLNGSGEVIGKIAGNGANGVSYQTSGSDFAEYFLKHDSHEQFAPGNIVCLDAGGGVTKCDSSHTTIVGVVSDRPAFIGNSGKQHDDSYILVGLQGQVPVTVSDENGPIHPSDSLTFSAIPGVAAKAIGPAPIVGQALEKQNDPSQRVNTYIKPGWFDPSPRTLSSAGNLQFTLQKKQDDTSRGYVLQKNDGSLLTSLGAFSDSIIGNLIVGIVNAKELTTEAATVTGSLLAHVLRVDQLTATESLVSPLASIDTIRTNIISPLSEKDSLSIVFEKQKIAFVNAASQKIAEIDGNGNASFSGTLSATSLNTTEDATIGGTLRVKKLIADEIESPAASTSGSTYITNVTNIYTSSSSGNITPTPTIEPTELATNDASGTSISPSSLLTDTLTTDSIPSSSFSGALASSGNLRFDFATITNGLMVFGPASFADISAAGQVSIGGNLILADAAINTLGRDLELQSLRQGNLSIMGGLLTIDTNGNLLALGNATFAKNVSIKGSLAAGIIKPVPDSDLIMQLGQTASQGSSLVVTDASGTARLSVNNIGDLIASGSGTFLKLMTENLNLVRNAQADTSRTETVASSSAGTAIITKGEEERTIISPFVSGKSLIYLTPTSDTYGVTPYISRQTPEDPKQNSKGSFTIEITRPVSGDVKLNWWIIN